METELPRPGGWSQAEIHGGGAGEPLATPLLTHESGPAPALGSPPYPVTAARACKPHTYLHVWDTCPTTELLSGVAIRASWKGEVPFSGKSWGVDVSFPIGTTCQHPRNSSGHYARELGSRAGDQAIHGAGQAVHLSASQPGHLINRPACLASQSFDGINTFPWNVCHISCFQQTLFGLKNITLLYC